MKVGVPTEIKTDEYRVSLSRRAWRAGGDGHEVLVQPGAGVGSTIPDASTPAQGGRILAGAEEVFAEAELMLGVKEPQPRGGGAAAPGTTCSSPTSTSPRSRSSRGPGGVRRHLGRRRDGR